MKDPLNVLRECLQESIPAMVLRGDDRCTIEILEAAIEIYKRQGAGETQLRELYHLTDDMRAYQKNHPQQVTVPERQESSPTKAAEPYKAKAFMDHALALMKCHYTDNDYGLNTFIRDMGYSKTLVNQRLRQLTGVPIGQFMKNYRLDMGRQLLERGRANVSEAAYAVGFNDPKYFTKCFKQRFGCLPSAVGSPHSLTRPAPSMAYPDASGHTPTAFGKDRI